MATGALAPSKDFSFSRMAARDYSRPHTSSTYVRLSIDGIGAIQQFIRLFLSRYHSSLVSEACNVE